MIVGAGIAGLAMYRALAQRGFNASIAEQSNFAGTGGAALFLPGNAVRAAEELGVLEGLMEASVPVTRQRFCDENGRLLNAIDTDGFWRGIAPCRSTKRSSFWALLNEGVNPEVISYRRIVRVTNDLERCFVTFENGDVADYDLVIGADGINSAVRKTAFPDAVRPAYVGNICWRLVIPNVCDLEDWTVMLGRDRSLLGIPLPSSQLYIYGDMSVVGAQLTNYSALTPLKPIFGDIAGPLSPGLELSSRANVHFSRLERLSLSVTYQNRVVLIGDAAHASPPSMAQGAAMAMEDAIVLAEELAGAVDLATALDRYQARRRQRVEWVFSQGSARDKMRRLPRIARNALLRFAGASLYSKAYTPLKKPI